MVLVHGSGPDDGASCLYYARAFAAPASRLSSTTSAGTAAREATGGVAVIVAMIAFVPWLAWWQLLGPAF